MVFGHIWGSRSLWLWILAILVPIPLFWIRDPVPDDDPDIDMEKVARCAYVIIVMAILWVTESLPIPVTALLPIFMFPMVGVDIAKNISSAYVTDTSMLFLGGLIVAVALEETGLHTRISVCVMMLVGAQPIMLMFGMMATTWFLSMWISNTAATSMMIPIIQSVVNTVRDVRTNTGGRGHDNIAFANETIQMEDRADGKDNSHKYIVNDTDTSQETSQTPPPERQTSHVNEETFANDSPEMRRLAKALALCVAYGANIGGIATLTGTPPNLVLKDVAEDLYVVEESPISFSKWMGFAFPMSLITLLIGWLWLALVFLRCSCFKKMKPTEKKAINDTIRQRYTQLGRITLAEVEVLIVFVLLVVLWLSRAPPNSDGWGQVFGKNEDKKGYVSDSTPVILLCVCLFILPAKWSFSDEHGRPKYQPILKWQVVAHRVPWGVILLLGGGFALAKAAKVSKLSAWVGEQLAYLDVFDTWIMNLLMCIIVASFTEITSNTATAQLLLPILKNLARQIQIHPLYLMMSATVSCSFAFMLPVATPPNAIVFSTGYLYIWEMALVGIPMNIIAVLCLTLSINTWGKSMFGLDTFPEMFALPTTLAPNTTTAMMNTTIP